MQIRKAHRSFFNISWIVISFLFFAACHSDHPQSQAAKETPDSLSHDPYSAELQAASTSVRAKNFTTTLVNGKTFQLSNQKGKVVVLNIWATWCPPCVEEMPELVDVYKQFKSKNIVFLGVSIDKQGLSVVKPFLKKHDVTYPITVDDGTIMAKYGPVMGIPTTYIIDQQGILQYFATGALTKQELEPRLNKLLGRKP